MPTPSPSPYRRPSNWLALDDLLRRFFHLVSRPDDGPPRWERNGREYPQERALAIAAWLEEVDLRR